MASLEVTRDGAIRKRIKDRTQWRRKWKAQYKKIRAKPGETMADFRGRINAVAGK